MGKDQIVQRLARLRQDAGEGQPLEPEPGDHTKHGVQDGFRRIQPVQALDEIEGPLPERVCFCCHWFPATPRVTLCCENDFANVGLGTPKL